MRVRVKVGAGVLVLAGAMLLAVVRERTGYEEWDVVYRRLQ